MLNLPASLTGYTSSYSYSKDYVLALNACTMEPLFLMNN